MTRRVDGAALVPADRLCAALLFPPDSGLPKLRLSHGPGDQMVTGFVIPRSPADTELWLLDLAAEPLHADGLLTVHTLGQAEPLRIRHYTLRSFVAIIPVHVEVDSGIIPARMPAGGFVEG